MPALLQKINADFLDEKMVQLYLFRDDLNTPIVDNPHIAGNKWRKLKYNIQKAKEENHDTLLTMGGAYSNHIHATAAAGKAFNLKTIGLIRGEEHLPLNPTLQFAVENNMQIHYIKRSKYRSQREHILLDQLEQEYGKCYYLPEGGTNNLAIKGCTEILNDININPNYICCPCGTGGTISGIIASSKSNQKVIGFPALKGDFLSKEVENLLQNYQNSIPKNWQLCTDYHFGGYAKIKPQLINFIKEFKQTQNIPLDPIYTGKMLFGIYDLIKKDHFPKESIILAIHTGGLQAIAGFNQRLGVDL